MKSLAFMGPSHYITDIMARPRKLSVDGALASLSTDNDGETRKTLVFQGS